MRVPWLKVGLYLTGVLSLVAVIAALVGSAASPSPAQAGVSSVPITIPAGFDLFQTDQVFLPFELPAAEKFSSNPSVPPTAGPCFSNGTEPIAGELPDTRRFAVMEGVPLASSAAAGHDADTIVERLGSATVEAGGPLPSERLPFRCELHRRLHGVI